ncbi:Elongator complex protein 4 [Nosema granulosis]|uniref:Elongator complex protein 4 n=1 Tax=Nosema granulosis TaxID=83296 RepID=A0A9P6H0E3_9MICR|nr:Elongator complex protein 4 [Nosema granulosis]
MSSFIKKQERKKMTTGIPLIDHILGEINPGTMIMIKEDEFSFIHNTLLNTFISEGARNNEKDLLVVSENESNIAVYEEKKNTEKNNDVKKMFIAWRYSSLNLEVPDFKFSLNRKIDYIGKKTIGISTENILNDIKNIKNHRIAIYSLFSPFYSDHIENVLFELRKSIRTNNHICMISIPTFLYENISFETFFDIVLKLNSNLMTGLLPNYRATIEFEKCASYKSLRCLDLESYIFGLKFKKDRLVVENIDIPPDEEDPQRDCSAF